jgi:GAF domain-containing protein
MAKTLVDLLLELKSLVAQAPAAEFPRTQAEQKIEAALVAARQQATAGEQLPVVEMLNQITDVANHAQDETEMLQLSAELIQRFAQVDHVGIVILHEVSDLPVLVAEYPITAALGTTLPDDERSLSSIMKRTRTEVPVPDVATSPLIQDDLRQVLLSVGARSMFLLPMLDLEGRMIGSIGLDINRPNAAPEGVRLELVRTITKQLSLNYQKLRLYRAGQRQAEQLRQINVFGQSVQANQTMAEIVNLALQTLRQLGTFDYTAIHVYSPETATLNTVSRWWKGEAMHYDVPQPMNVDANSPVQQAWMDRTPVTIYRLGTQSMYLHPLRGEIESLLAFPLMSTGQSVGVLELGSQQPFFFSRNEQAIYRQMANQLAAVLDNANAFSRAQHQAQAKALASEISTRLQQQVDLDTMLAVAADEVGRVLGARRVRIKLALNVPEEKR